MSQHIVEQDGRKFVYGWDQPLQSFYLQVHDLNRPEDEQIIAWYGGDQETTLYEVEALARVARRHGLFLKLSERTALYGEKDDGL